MGSYAQIAEIYIGVRVWKIAYDVIDVLIVLNGNQHKRSGGMHGLLHQRIKHRSPGNITQVRPLYRFIVEFPHAE